MQPFQIRTRTTRRGIAFEPHELRSIGIDEQSHCWGLWLDARRIDREGDLGQDDWYNRSSPQLVVAPLHPDHWATVFILKAQLQIRRISRPPEAPPIACDSDLGISDALRRCGVNILFVETARTSYKRSSFTAICEFPDLREAADRACSRADEAGRVMAATRARLHHDLRQRDTPQQSAAEEELREWEARCNSERILAFRELGKLLIPRIAELEARLLLIDHFRYSFWHARYGRPDRTVPPDHYLAMGQDDANYALLVGEAPPQESDKRAEEFERALSTAWFLNSRVVETGENPFFLSYKEIEGLRSSEQLDAGNEAIDPTAWREQGGLLNGDIAVLYEHALKMLHDRPLPEIFDRERGQAEAPPVLNVSGTAERVESILDAEAMEREQRRDSFRRQGIAPLRLWVLNRLSYARFWAFFGKTEGPHAQNDAERLEAPTQPQGFELLQVQFQYESGLLKPIPLTQAARPLQYDPLSDPPPMLMKPPMGDIFEFLNEATGAHQHHEAGNFGPQATVMANLDSEEGFLLMSFPRELAETSAYVTVNVRYRVIDEKSPSGANSQGFPNSQGLLSLVIGLLLKRGLRSWTCSNKITTSTKSREFGTITVVGRAFNKDGTRFCKWSAASIDQALIFGTDLERELEALLQQMRKPYKYIRVVVRPGFTERAQVVLPEPSIRGER